jgi:phosphatidylserine decarboxylase
MTLSRLTDRLKSWPLLVLPHHLLSSIVRAVTRWRVDWFKNLIISAFIRHFRVDMSEATDSSPEHYPDFNSFFTRSLKPGVRPQPDMPDAIASPVDGRISQLGTISDGCLLQAKGRDFSLIDLLGGDAERAQAFQGGKFATLYLSPRDYHRIHMPCDGRLMETVFIPGRLFSVAPHTTRTIPNLFTRNERLVALFETSSGPMAMVLVGAIFVACMETVWEGVIQPSRQGIRIRTFNTSNAEKIRLQRGDEMGRFNMGSTVILLYGPEQADWNPDLAAGQPLRVGQTMGNVKTGH